MTQNMPTVRGLLAAAVLAFGLSACSEGDAPAAAKIGEKLPPLKMQAISGGVVDSSALFSGKVVVLNLWATWCPPCRHEMPDLERLSKLLPADKFMVAGISVDNNLDDVKAFVVEQGLSFPMYWDQGGSAIASPVFRSFRFPETFILNADGVVVEKVAGAFPWASPEMIRLLKVVQKTGVIPSEGAAREG